MTNPTIKAEKREMTSRGDLKRMRREGRIPAVVYGEGVKAPTPISIDGKDLQAVLRSNPHAILELEVPGLGKKNVLMAEVQRQSMSREVIHVDFHKINMNQSIRVPVRLEVAGKSAGEKEGGVLQLVLHELEVECLPRNLPDMIQIDIESLHVGDSLTVGEIKLPDNVKTAVEPETVVATVLAPQKDVAEEEAEAGEPEGEAEKTAEPAGAAE